MSSNEVQRGAAERGCKQDGARQLERGVVLPAEERRPSGGEDLGRLADVHNQKEKWDEHRGDELLGHPQHFTNGTTAERPELAHRTSCTDPATTSRTRPVASRKTSSRVGSWSRDFRRRSSPFSSCGVPSRTMSPSSMIASWLQSWSASSRYCVVRKTVVPSALIRRISSQTVRRLAGSRPVVGSSRKRTWGRWTRAEAKSSRRFIPPE